VILALNCRSRGVFVWEVILPNAVEVIVVLGFEKATPLNAFKESACIVSRSRSNRENSRRTLRF
jgi:hypothetical protein